MYCLCLCSTIEPENKLFKLIIYFRLTNVSWIHIHNTKITVKKWSWSLARTCIILIWTCWLSDLMTLCVWGGSWVQMGGGSSDSVCIKIMFTFFGLLSSWFDITQSTSSWCGWWICVCFFYRLMSEWYKCDEWVSRLCVFFFSNWHRKQYIFFKSDKWKWINF